jgi:hypothetical protein
VLSANESIYFKLRCRKFIEMIRRCAELSDAPLPNLHPASKSDYNGVFEHEMELDESNGFDGMDTSDDLNNSGLGGVGIDGLSGIAGNGAFGIVGHGDLMEKTLEYGRELKDEFGGDIRREIKRTLEDTLALIAYPDPREGPLKGLLDVEGRVPIAEELNGAILGKLFSLLYLRLYFCAC